MRKRTLQELNRLTVEAYRQQEKTPVVLVLDNIRSALNVGSAFRTADAFALEKVYLCGITAKPPHREILKTAIGAAESVDWEYWEDIGQLVEALRKAGYRIWAVEQAEGSTPLQDFQPAAGEQYALIVGNEVRGVSELVMNRLDGALEVPQFGTKHSLNVAVCTGVVLWEVMRKLRL